MVIFLYFSSHHLFWCHGSGYKILSVCSTLLGQYLHTTDIDTFVLAIFYLFPSKPWFVWSLTCNLNCQLNKWSQEFLLHSDKLISKITSYHYIQRDCDYCFGHLRIVRQLELIITAGYFQLKYSILSYPFPSQL